LASLRLAADWVSTRGNKSSQHSMRPAPEWVSPIRVIFTGEVEKDNPSQVFDAGGEMAK